MKYTIDEDTCIKKGMDFPSFFLALAIRVGANKQTLEQMLEKEILVKDVFNDICVTPRWSNVIDEILLANDADIPKDEHITELAKKLRDIFPPGKNDSGHYYKCNMREIIDRLKKFYKYFGNYTDDQILDAAQRYIDTAKPFTRTLKNFIWKNEIKESADGKRYIELVSDLETYIENKNNDDEYNGHWSTIIV